MLHSEQIDALSAALVKAQANIEGARKDSTNPHFKNKYADLSSVWAAIKQPLSDNKLAVIQSPGPTSEGRMEMTTRIVHESGQWIEGTMSIPVAKLDPQGYGSATTYARRYALAAMVGVSPEDDDGNAASRTPANQQEPVKVISDAQYTELNTLVAATHTDLEKFCKFYRCDALIRLPAERFDHARQALSAKLKDAA